MVSELQPYEFQDLSWPFLDSLYRKDRAAKPRYQPALKKIRHKRRISRKSRQINYRKAKQ